MWCSSCGEELPTDVDEAVHDPEGEWLADKIGVDPEPVGDQNSHVQIIYRDTGPIPQCQKKKEFTKVTPHPPGEEGEGGGEPKKQNEGGGNGGGGGNARSRPQKSGVYEEKPDKSPMKILGDVVGNPAYELSQEQIQEIKSWGEVYDGQIPPDQLEEILGSLSGVSKQRANLIRKKYEAMLNKWIRKESNSSTGPSLGAASGPMPSSRTTGPQQRPQQPTPNRQPAQGQQTARQQEQERRQNKSRSEKREEMVDEAADKFAKEFAKNAADGAGLFIKDIREIGRTLFKKKAEQDPDWFFEKMEKWDMDLFDEFMAMSDAKKEEEQAPSMETEMEVDQALESVKAQGGNSRPQPEPEPRHNGAAETPQTEQEPEDNFSDIKNMLDDEIENMLDDEIEEEEVMAQEPPEEEPEQFDDETEALLKEMEE